jgi:hypothetical protein
MVFGYHEHHTIRWGTFMDKTPKTLSYTLESQHIGQFEIDGTASFMGKALRQQTEIIFDCIPQPEQVSMPTVQSPDKFFHHIQDIFQINAQIAKSISI